MAKYTELLAEYLESGGQLPAAFDNIEGFKDLFIGTYADHEIGFETPTLFTVKLETRANLVIPPYAARISELTAARESLINPTKTRIRSGSTAREYGEQNETNTNNKSGEIIHTDEGGSVADTPDHITNTYNNPMGIIPGETLPTVPPSQVVNDTASQDVTYNKNSNTESYKEYEDKNTRHREQYTDKELYNNIKDEETGFTSSEAQALISSLESQVFIIQRELLNEFASLFMQVF